MYGSCLVSSACRKFPSSPSLASHFWRESSIRLARLLHSPPLNTEPKQTYNIRRPFNYNLYPSNGKEACFLLLSSRDGKFRRFMDPVDSIYSYFMSCLYQATGILRQCAPDETTQTKVDTPFDFKLWVTQTSGLLHSQAG